MTIDLDRDGRREERQLAAELRHLDWQDRRDEAIRLRAPPPILPLSAPSTLWQHIKAWFFG